MTAITDNFMHAPTVSLYLKPYQNAAGLSRLYIRVRWRGIEDEARRKTDIVMSADAFKDITSDHTTKANRVLKTNALSIKEAVQDIIDRSPAISPRELQSIFDNKKEIQQAERLSSLFDDKIEELTDIEKKTNRSNSKRYYKLHKRLALEFFGDVAIYQIKASTLREYEYHILRRKKKEGEPDNSWNTVKTYMSPIKHLYNRAIRAKIVPANLMPFGPRQYEIPGERKKNGNFLSKGETIKFLEYDLGLDKLEEDLRKRKIKSNNRQLTNARKCQYYRDFWFLLYQLLGLNPGDLLHVKYRDIVMVDGKRKIRIYRNKTFGHRKNIKQLDIEVSDKVWTVIMKYANKSLDPNAFLFNVLNAEMTVDERNWAIEYFCMKMADFNKKIADKIGLSKVPKAYTARHTFARDILNATGNVAFLGQCLGHGEAKTTQHYVHNFENDYMTEALGSLYVPKAIAI